MILKSELKATNKITAIGALAVPVLRYSFGIINWRIEEIKQIDRKTRKMLTIYKMHHPKSDIDRLYVKRKEGGRGLVQIETAYKEEIIKLKRSLRKNLEAVPGKHSIDSLQKTAILGTSHIIVRKVLQCEA